jgi:hypothetical protein
MTAKKLFGLTFILLVVSALVDRSLSIYQSFFLCAGTVATHVEVDPKVTNELRYYIERLNSFEKIEPTATLEYVMRVWSLAGFNVHRSGQVAWVDFLGSRESAGPIVIAAHYNGVNASDDNATGLAAMISLTKSLVNFPFGKTVRFFIFDARFPQEYPPAVPEKAEGVIVLDSLAKTGKVTFSALVGSRAFMNIVTSQFAEKCDLPEICYKSLSNHEAPAVHPLPIWNTHVPTLLLSDFTKDKYEPAVPAAAIKVESLAKITVGLRSMLKVLGS